MRIAESHHDSRWHGSAPSTGSAMWFPVRLSLLVLTVIVWFASDVYGSYLPRETVVRSFGQSGEVSIAAFLPIFQRDEATGECTQFRAIYTLGLAGPFLYFLRKRNFTLRAVAIGSPAVNSSDAAALDSPEANCTGNCCSNELVRELKIGFQVADACDGLLDPVMISLAAGHMSPGRYASTADCTMDGSDFSANGDSLSDGPVADNNVVAVFEAIISAQTLVTAPLLSSYGVLQVSSSATNDELACHLTSTGMCAAEHEYFFRAVPTRARQVHVITAILKRLNWTHFGLISSTEFSHLGLSIVQEARSSLHGFCLAFDQRLTNENSRIQEAILELERSPQVKVVIFLSLTNDAYKLFGALVEYCQEDPSKNACLPRVWFGNDGWAYMATHQFFSGQHGTAGLSTLISIVPEVPPHFASVMSSLWLEYLQYGYGLTAEKLRLSRQDPWLCMAMEQLANCTGVCEPTGSHQDSNMCANSTQFPRSLQEHSPLTESAGYHPQLLATEVILVALQDLFQTFVNSNRCVPRRELGKHFTAYAHKNLRRAMKNVQLPCTDQGRPSLCRVFPGNQQEVQPSYVIYASARSKEYLAHVGTWKLSLPNSSNISSSELSFNANMIRWPQHRSIKYTASGVLISDCTPTCSQGEVIVAAQGSCCHVCVRCANNSIASSNRTCTKCPVGEMSLDSMDCVPLPTKGLRLCWFVSLATLTIICMMVIGATCTIYVKASHSPIVRSDLKLTWTLLASLLTVLMSSGLLLFKPTTEICTAQRLLCVPAMLISVSVLCVKTSRLARLRLSASRLHQNTISWTMTNSAQFLLIFLITIAGAAVDILHAVARPLQPQVILSTEKNFRLCSSPTALNMVVDGYVLFIILLTTALAFVTRKLPMNFNEARLLFLCGFSLVTSWLGLRTVFYLSKGDVQILMECLHLNSHVCIIWLWLFLPRLYIIVMRPEKNRASIPMATKLSFESSAHFSTALVIAPMRLMIGSASAGGNLSGLSKNRRASCTVIERGGVSLAEASLNKNAGRTRRASEMF